MYFWYRNGIGEASCQGVRVTFDRPPRLPGISFHDIEYLGTCGRAVVWDQPGSAERPMTEAEVWIVRRALGSMAKIRDQLF